MNKTLLLAALAACAGAPDAAVDTSAANRGGAMMPGDSTRRAFADTVAAMLLDTTVLELRGHLAVKIPNPNRDDESPLADRDVAHPPDPGPHTMDGTFYAELGVLRALFGNEPSVTIDTLRDHVLVGSPPVRLVGHRHGDALFVPVKLFARQFGAYTDIGCTLANCATIWPRDVIELMVRKGATGGAGVLNGHAEGLVRRLDVMRLPGG
jgi:hypothetical protein